MALLEVKNLNLAFFDDKQKYHILRDINFTVDAGEHFGIVGESGCGKSLTAYSVLGLLPDAAKIIGGEILYRGRDLIKMSNDQLTALRGNEIAMIFQNPVMALNPVLTVGNQIVEAIITHSNLTKKQALMQTVGLLEELQLPNPEKIIKEYPHNLSGGMCQRIVIAIALSCRPEMLIADEPTTALDVTVQRQVLDLIKEVCSRRKMSLIIISHDLSVVSYMSTKVGVMYCGKFIETGKTDEILSNPSHPYTKGLLDSVPRRGFEIRTIDGVVPKISSWSEVGCMFHSRCRYAEEKCEEPFGYVEEPSGRRTLCCKLGEL